MTVAELRVKLAECPDDAVVVVRGWGGEMVDAEIVPYRAIVASGNRHTADGRWYRPWDEAPNLASIPVVYIGMAEPE